MIREKPSSRANPTHHLLQMMLHCKQNYFDLIALMRDRITSCSFGRC
jgi:hypothetical protein